MQKPLVSVIVPIYNAQNNIVRCVESIRRQTYENLEILLLNDGSKDVSYPVCEMLSKADARIVLIDKENSGVSATRNLGMRMARGKYLQFVDADDTLEPLAAGTLSNRNKHDSLFVKLFHQRSGDFRAAGRDNDTVVRRGPGHTEGAVPEVHPYPAGMQEVQDAGRTLIKPGQTLHGIH